MNDQDSRLSLMRRCVDESGWPLGGAMPAGEYVAATDYDEVCQQLRDAAGENERLRSQLAGAVGRVAELESAITAACAMRGHPTGDARETLFDALGIPARGQ